MDDECDGGYDVDEDATGDSDNKCYVCCGLSTAR